LKLPTTHRAHQMTLSRGRVSCDIQLPSNETPGLISSKRSRCCTSGSTLRRWNAVATMPVVSPRRRSFLRTWPEKLGRRSSLLRR
jgi:hypothetical protein